MKYLRCECGKREYWHSGMPPRDCEGCDDCGKTFGASPMEHKDRIPHDMRPHYDSRTGKQIGETCERCHCISYSKIEESDASGT